VSYRLKIEIEREEDGRWIAEIPALPGVMAYGDSQDEASQKVCVLALRVLADRIESSKPGPASEEFTVSLACAR
jgi:predicted RNase H-like HicB family nuclease